MNDYSRDIIFLLKEHGCTQEYIDQEVQFVHKVIACVDTDEKFCTAHELATRNRITAKKRKILKAINRPQLKAFEFLINKN
ncbi:hypothetical protein LL912_19940 [Niabella sp. CC-SYL272]|uniref:hypothetical protein n=1 Tax=Niabella agricola TaxID=2891571 RepID=UPI001F1A2462|nr:hypothetical protein [Niabella agricola]MCF3111069.1 hypothetical protein [Niabella agricola]